ncbi:hypothetical protein K7W42_15710 [Deinococcus sp. HMF7604]|uniref:hypothetical protein n=1 Tax=Deinococcus betulae TaxID=2873312 RepID=UPI001CCD9925|nr:hypothetical protein [Deinococcus betulae]MBZ9752299.1 hypothetical protein [Deinococcus betulae]
MSTSEVHAGIKRLKHSRLVKGEAVPIRTAVRDVLRYGVPYFLPAERGELTRGFPTAHAAPPLNELIVQGNDPPPVWPDPDGPVRGQAFQPLYRSVPFAARQDPGLYEWLALIDALRGGSTRERHLATGLLEERLLMPVSP